MAKTKTTTKTQRKGGTKTTAKRAAGKVAKAGTRVTAKSMAADIVRRDNKRAGFWDEVQREIRALWHREGTATALPREHHATH